MEGYVYVILTILFWGVTAVIDKIALKGANPMQGLFIRTVTVFTVVITAFFVTGLHKTLHDIPKKNILFFSLSGLFAGCLGMITYYSALKKLPASLVVPLCAVYPLVAAIFAVLFLKEQLTLVRFLGTVCIILGVWLVK